MVDAGEEVFGGGRLGIGAEDEERDHGGGEGHGEGGAQAGQRRVAAGADGAFADLKDPGDLGVAELGDVAELDDAAQVFGEVGDRVADGGGALLGEGEVFGRVDHGVGVELVLERGADAVPAALGGGEVQRGAEQVGARRRRAQRGAGLPHAGERLLHDLRRVVGVADPATDGTEQRPFVRDEQGLDGLVLHGFRRSRRGRCSRGGLPRCRR